MPINLLDEQENHFVLHDGNESFPVAKFGLDDTTMAQIRSLPQGYADGGFVQSPQADMRAAYPSADVIKEYLSTPPPLPSSTEPTYVERYFRQDKGPAIEPYAGINFATPEQLDAMKLKKGAPIETDALGLEVEQPKTEAPTAQPAYLSQMNQIMGAGGAQTSGLPGQSPYGLPSEYAQGYQTMIDASKQQAAASAQAAEEQARIYDQQVKEIQKAELQRQQQEAAVQQDLDKIRDDIATQKIDPTRVWSNMSTGNRVLAGISIFLGGVAGGMQGTDNKALGIINDAINKDIDAQKSELGKKQNLLAINLQKYRNIQDAAAATKAQLMAVTQAQVNQAAAKAGSKQALAAAQMFQGQTELEMGKLKMQLAASQMTQAKLSDPRGLTPQEAQKMSQDIKDTLVQMPNGQYYQAKNKESAFEVSKQQAKLLPIKALVAEANNFIDQGYTLPASRRNAEAERLKSNILVELKNLKELGQLTEADMDIINPLLPNLGSFFEGKSRDALASINRQIDNKLNAVYSAYIPGLNPMGRQSREQSVFGRP